MAGPISMRIPRGRIIKSMTITPTQNRTRPTNGWKTLMAIDSPHSFPAKKMKVMRAEVEDVEEEHAAGEPEHLAHDGDP